MKRVQLVGGPADGQAFEIPGPWLALSPESHPDEVYELVPRKTPAAR
jgi:hypothetical protein